MTCPNRGDGWLDWICLCPTEGRSAKEHLKTVWNGWVASRLPVARAIANKPETTEEQAAAVIATLEEEASGSMEMWRQCQ